jgi:acetylornithine deacetylase/succinyl-diaminopimelate desuccinylase-like protein
MNYARSTLLALSVCGLVAASPVIGQPTPIADDPLATEILHELVELKPIHKNGSTKAAEAMARRFLAAGFAADDVNVLVPPEYPAKGNVVVRLHGAGAQKPILFIGHLDVVDAKPEDWTHDPFKLTEKDGWLYGRGTSDMLGQDAAMIASFIRLKREGYMPARDLILALTADEEAEGEINGVEWLLANHRSLIDAELVVNPDGGEAGAKNGRNLTLGIQTSEKMSLSFDVEITDKGGHSSIPTPSNPIHRLAQALARFSAYQFPLHLTSTTRLYFQARAELAQGQMRQDMISLISKTPDPKAVARLSAIPEINSFLRTTCTPTLIAGGHAENALPQRAKVTLQCRAIPGETQADIHARIATALGDSSAVITSHTPGKPSPESPPNEALLKTVRTVTQSLWPEVVLVPNMSPGASDGVYTRTKGLPTYGIDAMFDDLSDVRAHGRDERINVQSFKGEVEFIYRLMTALTAPNSLKH